MYASGRLVIRVQIAVHTCQNSQLHVRVAQAALFSHFRQADVVRHDLAVLSACRSLGIFSVELRRDISQMREVTNEEDKSS